MHSIAPFDGRASDPDDLLSAKKVRAACGDWSDMTLWRNTHHPDPEIAFPAPDVVLNGRKYWRRRTIEVWRTRQAERTRARAPSKPPCTTPPSATSVEPKEDTSSETPTETSERPSNIRHRLKEQGDVSP